jgi:hypothetical protein
VAFLLAALSVLPCKPSFTENHAVLLTIFHLLNCAVCGMFALPCDMHACCHHGNFASSTERVHCLVKSQEIYFSQIAAPGSLEILPSGR